MQLSKRLAALAGLVTPGHCLADVGTDHGYVPIYLIEKKKIPRAIAMDINPGPLERAREHIRQFGYEDYIETRLSDGVHALGAGEADTVLIAGMGGALMQRILEEGKRILSQVPELILQPQSELYAMRRYLEAAGYEITREAMVYEEGKYYPILKVRPGDFFWQEEKEGHRCRLEPGAEVFSGGREETGLSESGLDLTDKAAVLREAEYYFGRIGLQQNPQELLGFVEKSISVQRQILEGLSQTQGERTEKRRRQVEEMLVLLETCGQELRRL
ncbi:MAG: SAM-dependent methyltransferase [Lachnospiraceae bacterium]|jgi:tRNA (adenine22-N1)-methyltransferase|nr:SAM-dependent methyltransferase [Lachnospiraceae bacterium]